MTGHRAPGLPPGLRQPPARVLSGELTGKTLCGVPQRSQILCGKVDFGPPIWLRDDGDYRVGGSYSNSWTTEGAHVSQSKRSFTPRSRHAVIEFIKDETEKVTELVANSSGIQVKGTAEKVVGQALAYVMRRQFRMSRCGRLRSPAAGSQPFASNA